MITYQRYDRGELRTSIRTDEGYVLAEGFAARPGVLEYRQADGSIRRELVTEEELHRADSLETLGRKPVTLEHPVTDSGERVFVAPENVQTFGVGDVSEEVEIERLNGFVKIRMALRRKDAIEAVDAGVRELSAGYTVDLDMTPGEHPIYGRYDARQLNRKYNHVAITRMGRAGAQVGLRADSAVQVTPFQSDKSTPPKLTPQQEKAMADKVKESIKEALERHDAKEKAKKVADENAALKKKVDELQGKIDALMKKDEGEEDDKKSDKKTDSASRMIWFRQRTDAVETAQKIGVNNIPDELDILDIKRAVVEKYLGESRADASEERINGTYDVIKMQIAERSQQQSYSGLSNAFSPTPRLPEAQPRQDSMSPEEAYRSTLNKAFKR